MIRVIVQRAVVQCPYVKRYMTTQTQSRANQLSALFIRYNMRKIAPLSDMQGGISAEQKEYTAARERHGVVNINTMAELVDVFYYWRGLSELVSWCQFMPSTAMKSYLRQLQGAEAQAASTGLWLQRRLSELHDDEFQMLLATAALKWGKTSADMEVIL